MTDRPAAIGYRTLVPPKNRKSPSPDQLAAALLQWFGANARDLPWRRTSDPYAIWISEVMLQQTQIRTVIPYWERWMQALPDVRALARAPMDDVLKLWEGLGYYRRARNLQAAAKTIMQKFEGRFPTAFDDVLGLPGIGRYTAGAICSIAFDQPTPILDGNVTRVVARLFGIAGLVRSSRVQSRLWERARQLVEAAGRNRKRGNRPCSSFNQALMELGATICRPQPDCERCPVANLCTVRRTNRFRSIPNLGKRPAIERRTVIAFLALRKGQVAVRRRPAHVLNGGLWEFPNLEVTANDSDLDVFALATSCLGIEPRSVAPFCRVQHSVTKFRVETVAYIVRVERRRPRSGSKGLFWRPLEETRALAMPSAHRKLALTLVDGTPQGRHTTGR